MKKFWAVASIFSLVGALLGAGRLDPATRVPATNNKHYEPAGQEIIPRQNSAAPTSITSIREDGVILIDSSKNGYGLLVAETNPLEWDPVNNRFLIAYRQWAGATASSGVIGAALSEDGGASFSTYSNLNAGVGANQAGRYPSALATPDYPLIIWNEYGGGGGTYGGRAYYTYDEGNYGGEIFSPPADLSTTPSTNDIWQGSPTASYEATTGNMYINATYSDWTDPRNKYLFHTSTNGAWDGTPLAWNAPVVMLDQSREFLGDASSNYTSNGVLDINDNGVGYFVVSAYWNDTLAIANHTLFVKQTTDYGVTWSDWRYIPDPVMDAYFREVMPDSVQSSTDSSWSYLDPDWTPFVNYDMDVMTDADGGCHIFAGVLPSAGGFVYPGWAEQNGLYHFYSPQNDLFNWDISFVASLQYAWFYDDPGWQGVFPTAAMDTQLDSTLYVTYYTVPDTSAALVYLDVMGTYSSDNGMTWAASVNISNTEDPTLDETDPHLARKAGNGTVYLIYQMPDYDMATVDPPATSEDYKNRIFFRSYTFGNAPGSDVNPENSKLPGSFALSQNYPNPFNPVTTLAFDLPLAGQTRLAIYNLLGEAVATPVNQVLTAGHHSLQFDASQLASGLYLYRLESGSFSAVRKMMLMK